MTTTTTANAIYFTLNADVEPGAVVDHDRDFDLVELVELDEQDYVHAVLRPLTREEVLDVFAGRTPFRVDGYPVGVPSGDYFSRITLRDREEYGNDEVYDAWVAA